MSGVPMPVVWSHSRGSLCRVGSQPATLSLLVMRQHRNWCLFLVCDDSGAGSGTSGVGCDSSPLGEGLKKRIKVMYDNWSWYMRSFLKPAPDLNDAQLKVACFARVLPRQHSRVHQTWTEVSCLQSWLVIPPPVVLFPLTKADLNS